MFIIFGILLFWQSALVQSQYNCTPYGARISLGYYYYNQSEDLVHIAYNTPDECNGSFIQIENGTVDQDMNLTESHILNMTQIYEFSPKVHFDYVTYIHQLALTIPTFSQGQTITYKLVGMEGQESSWSTFTIPNITQSENETKRIVFFGDMDSRWDPNNSNYTFDWFQDQAAHNRSEYDLLFFLGDMAYDLESTDCWRGDYYLRNISTFTNSWPMLNAPGNHDAGNDTYFPYFRNTFYSPQLNQYNTQEYYLNFYSFDLGLAHFIQYNPYWIVYNYSIEYVNETFYNLMEEDLIKANSNRANVPWIIVCSHYPMYCSDPTDSQCSQNWEKLQNFSALFTKYGVQMYIAAHQHNYERDAPFINNETAQFKTNGPSQNVYEDSNAPVYIVEGSAGNDYYMPTTNYPNQPYTVYQSEQRGVGVLTILNRTHLLFQQILSQTNEQTDFVYVIQNSNEIDEGPQQSKHTVYWILLGLLLVTMLVAMGWLAYYLKKRKDQQDQATLNSGSLEQYQLA